MIEATAWSQDEINWNHLWYLIHVSGMNCIALIIFWSCLPPINIIVETGNIAELLSCLQPGKASTFGETEIRVPDRPQEVCFLRKKSSCCGHSKQANWASKRLGPQLPDLDVAMRHFQELKISEKNYVKKTRKNWTNPQKPWNTWKTLGQVIQVHAVQHNTKPPKRTPIHICSIGVFNMFLDVLSSPSIFLGSLRV